MLTIDEKRDGEMVTLALAGRLDALAAPELEGRVRALDEAACRRVVVDLAGLEYVASSGLRIFLALAKLVKRAGGKLAFCGLSKPVLKIFEMSGCVDIFTVVATADEAAGAVKG